MPRARKPAAGEAIDDWPGQTHLLAPREFGGAQGVRQAMYMALHLRLALQLLLENHLAGAALSRKSAENLSTGSPPPTPTPSLLGNPQARVLHIARQRGLPTGDVSTLTERGQAHDGRDYLVSDRVGCFCAQPDSNSTISRLAGVRSSVFHSSQITPQSGQSDLEQDVRFGVR